MNNSEVFVQLALDTLSCSQKELALRLGVSPTQISKWKKGDYISNEMEDKIRAMVNIGHKDPGFVLWAGSVEAANKWENLIHFWLKPPTKTPKRGTTLIPCATS